MIGKLTLVRDLEPDALPYGIRVDPAAHATHELMRAELPSLPKLDDPLRRTACATTSGAPAYLHTTAELERRTHNRGETGEVEWSLRVA